ncbi:MAG: hypothetical protein IT355_15990 [Gemmatimonadaceae bacterium]|nr:hypothetical protein [Gemmatimonadaceae bacterium]
MHNHLGPVVMRAFLALLAAACTKAEGPQNQDSARSTAGASAANDTGGMPAMRGMASMSGQSGTMDSSMAGMPVEMRTHVMAITGATGEAMTVMLPKHRQLVANMIARMNGEMRDMQMASDAAWSATVDSLRADLIRLPEMSGPELKAMMPAHLARVTRLNVMHAGMMRGMAR